MREKAACATLNRTPGAYGGAAPASDHLPIARRSARANDHAAKTLLFEVPTSVRRVLRPGFETPGWAYSGGQLYSGRSVLIKSILIGSHLGWGKMTVAGDEPIFVIMPCELDECGSQFFDCVEGPYPQ